MSTRHAVGFALFWVVAASAPLVRAQGEEFHVDSATSFHVYDIRSRTGGVFMARRRLIQSLGFDYARVLGDELERPEAPVVRARTELRLDQEFGDTCLVDRELCFRATNRGATGSYQPVADDSVLEALTAYVEADRLPLGSAVRLGRQLQIDPLGFVRFDGISASVAPIAPVRIGGFAGLWVRRASLLGGGGYEPLGVIRRDLDQVDPARAPFVDEPADTWLIGARLEAEVAPVVRGSAHVREAWDEAGLVERRAGGELTLAPHRLVSAVGRSVWDLLDPDPIEIGGELSSRVTDELALRLSATRRRPSFDLGSIWYYFEPVPIVFMSGGANVTPDPDVSLGANVIGRAARVAGSNEVDLGGELTSAVAIGRTRLSGRVLGSEGDLGPMWTVAVDGRRRLVHWLTGALTLSSWVLDQPDARGLSGVSVSEALTLAFHLSEETTAEVDLSHAYSDQVGHRVRFFSALRIEVWR